MKRAGRESKALGRAVVAGFVVWFASACAADPFAPPPGQCQGILFETRACIALILIPAGPSAILTGDTIRLTTMSDSGYGSVKWSISSASMEFVTATGLAASVQTPVSTVLVRGTAPGSATVTATHASPVRTVSSTIAVADSSAITQMVFSNFTTPTSWTVKAGDSLPVFTSLRAADATAYRGSPDSWSTTDATRATVRVHSCQIGAFCSDGRAAYIIGRAPGTVDIIAGFGGLRGTINVTVTP